MCATTSKGNVRYYELISETSDTPSFSDKIYDNLLQSTPEGIMRVADELAEHSDELEEIEEKLRHLSNTQSPNKIQLLISKVSRNPKIAQLIKERQNYICEICNREPFIQANGTPYAEADHIKPLGGSGGAPDFAGNSKIDAIFGLPSRRWNKEEARWESNIVLDFEPGSTVVAVPANRILAFATEHGIAYLRPHDEDGDMWIPSQENVAKAMIAIAHPDFREELTQQAIERGLIDASRVPVLS